MTEKTRNACVYIYTHTLIYTSIHIYVYMFVHKRKAAILPPSLWQRVFGLNTEGFGGIGPCNPVAWAGFQRARSIGRSCSYLDTHTYTYAYIYIYTDFMHIQTHPYGYVYIHIHTYVYVSPYACRDMDSDYVCMYILFKVQTDF